MDLTIAQALERGVAAHKEGKLQEAEKLYRAILQSQPQHPDANHNLGVLAVGVGKVEGAIPYFKAALVANAKMEQYWLSYIDALIKLNQMDTAKAVLEQARGSGLQGEKFDNLGVQLSGEKTSSLDIELKRLTKLVNSGEFAISYDHGIRLLNSYPNNHILNNICGAVCSHLGRF